MEDVKLPKEMLSPLIFIYTFMHFLAIFLIEILNKPLK
jgi:hypothetical protein